MKQFIKYLLARIYILFHPKIVAELDAAQPIFILGCGHSGTSVFLAMLDSHSKVQAIGEETQILQFEENSSIIRWKLHRRVKKFVAPRWVEKTPRHVHHIEKIVRIFPTAKVVIMLRDGRDVACSIKRRYSDFERGLARWLKDNEAALSYWSHPQVYVLKLEDLQTETERSLRQVFDFLELPFEREVLTFHEQKRFFYDKKVSYSKGKGGEAAHSQRRNWQINQPLKKNTSRWQVEMTSKERELFKVKAQHLLQQFGYAADEHW